MRLQLIQMYRHPLLLATAIVALASGPRAIGAPHWRAAHHAAASGEAAQIEFTLPQDERISLNIYNADGKIVSELLHGVSYRAGQNTVDWDGRDYSGNALSAGAYSWRLLGTHGLRAVYVTTLGDNPEPAWEQWPGGYGGIYSVCCDHSSVYLGGYGPSTLALVKQSLAGKRDWVVAQAFEPWQGPISMGRASDRLYVLQPNGMVYRLDADTGQQIGRFNASWSAYTPVVPSSLSGIKQPKPDLIRPPTSAISQPTDMACSDDMVAVSYYDHDAVRWYQASTGREIEEARISHPLGVAFDKHGQLLVISDGSVSAMLPADKKPRPLITGIPDAYRIAVTPRSGDILVAMQGTAQQVARYNADGKSIKTYGALGGRQLGIYNPRNFSDITSICADSAGGFIVSEANPPRRLARFDSSGAMTGEWFGPQPPAPQAAIDPQDAGTAWGESSDGKLIEYHLNLAGKFWSVQGVFACRLIPQDRDSSSASGWQILHHEGTVYLSSAVPARIYKIDEQNGSLVPVAGLLTVDPVADLPGLPDTIRHGRATRLRVLWSDTNGNGAVDTQEVAAQPDPAWSAASKTIIGHDFSLTSVAGRIVHRIVVQSWSPSGAPIYGPETQVTLDRGEGPPLKVDEIATAQSGATWTTCTVDTGADKPLRGVVKWDKTGRIGFAVGVTAEPGKIGRIVGVVHGCVAVADQIHRNVDVWDNDGLWVGQFLENPDFAIAPRPAYRLAPGFIDGSVYVDPHSDNVYFVGRGVNNDPILRIDGWSGWDQQDGMVALR